MRQPQEVVCRNGSLDTKDTLADQLVQLLCHITPALGGFNAKGLEDVDEGMLPPACTSLAAEGNP
jgi:hypothetical protein